MDATTRRSSPTKAINACPNADLQWCVAPGLVSIPIATPITAENVGISAAITKSAIADRANRQVRRRARPHAIPIVGVVARRVSMCSPIRKTAVHVASPAPMASLASTENAMSSPLANVAMAKFATKTAIASSNAVRRFAAPMARPAATLVRRSTPSNTADLAITPAKAMPPSANTAHAPTNARHKHAKPKVPNVEPSTTDAAMHSIADRATMARSALRINASTHARQGRAKTNTKTAVSSTTVAEMRSPVANAPTRHSDVPITSASPSTFARRRRAKPPKPIAALSTTVAKERSIAARAQAGKYANPIRASKKPCLASRARAKLRAKTAALSTMAAETPSTAARARDRKRARATSASIPLVAPRLARQRAKTAAPSTTVAAESSTVAPARGQKNAKTTSAPIPNANQRLVPNKVKNADRQATAAEKLSNVDRARARKIAKTTSASINRRASAIHIPCERASRACNPISKIAHKSSETKSTASP